MAISSISATDTTYPMMINGYVCYSAAEAQAARNFTDPRQSEKIAEAKAAGAKAAEAKRAESARTTHSPYATRDDINRPLKSGTRGTVINILA